MKPDGRLTLEDMDTMQCATPGCTHRDHNDMYFNQRCHPGADAQVKFVRDRRAVVVECSQCKREIAAIAVEPS